MVYLDLCESDLLLSTSIEHDRASPNIIQFAISYKMIQIQQIVSSLFRVGWASFQPNRILSSKLRMSMGVFILRLENNYARIYYEACFSRGVANYIASFGFAIKHCAWRISWAVLRNMLLHLILSPKKIHGHICIEMLHLFAVLICEQRSVCRRVFWEASQIILWHLIV